MRAFEILHNGSLLCLAGFPRAKLLSVELAADVESVTAALSVHGIADADEKGDLHLWWMNHFEIRDQDELALRLVESEKVTPPSEIEEFGTSEFIARQRAFEEMIVANPVAPRTPVRGHAGVRFQIRQEAPQDMRQVGGQVIGEVSEPVSACLDEPREFLTLRLTWQQVGAERGRFSARSFSQVEALARTGGRDWISGSLALGETVKVRVVYDLAVQEAVLEAS